MVPRGQAEATYEEASLAHSAWRREAQRREAALEETVTALGASLAASQRRLAEANAKASSQGAAGRPVLSYKQTTVIRATPKRYSLHLSLFFESMVSITISSHNGRLLLLPVYIPVMPKCSRDCSQPPWYSDGDASALFEAIEEASAAKAMLEAERQLHQSAAAEARQLQLVFQQAKASSDDETRRLRRSVAESEENAEVLRRRLRECEASTSPKLKK